MRVVVLGGNGNIGGSLVTKLIAGEHEVACFNRGLSGPCHGGAEVIIGDRNDRATFEKAMQARKFDAAVDLTSYNKTDAESSIRAFRDVEHFIHCSTVATYGRKFDQVPTPETHPSRPHNEYGRDKVEADRALLAAHSSFGFPVTILKPAVTYGKRSGLIRQIGQDLMWLSRIRAGMPIVVSGDGTAVHQFMHVDDLALIIVALLGNGVSKGQVVNAVQPVPTSWNDYHCTAMKVLGRDVELVGAPDAEIFAASAAVGKRVNDIWSHNSFFCSEKLLRLTKFSPTISLYDGMAEVIETLLAERRLPGLQKGGWEDRLIDTKNAEFTSADRSKGTWDRVNSTLTVKANGNRHRFIDDILAPRFDAPQESRVVKLVTEGIDGFRYNVVTFGDVFWALHWEEGSFDVERILSGNSAKPVLVGVSKEEISYGLKRLHPQAASAPYTAEPVDDALNGRIFEKLNDRFYLLNTGALEEAPAELQETPTFKNSRLPMENLFESADGNPIMIISPAPARTCNYRCEYCYHHDYGFHKNTEATERWSDAILTAVTRIRRPIRLSAGAMGEPLFIPKWRETALKILERENVLSLAFVSNLTHDVEKFVERVDPNRIAVMASLHPTQFKDHDRDWNAFLGRLAYLKKAGVSVVVNYVLTPDQVNKFVEYRSAIFLDWVSQ